MQTKQKYPGRIHDWGYHYCHLGGWSECCCRLSHSFRLLLSAWDKPCSRIGVVGGRDLCLMEWYGDEVQSTMLANAICGWGYRIKRVRVLVLGLGQSPLRSPAKIGGAASRPYTRACLPPQASVCLGHSHHATFGYISSERFFPRFFSLCAYVCAGGSA